MKFFKLPDLGEGIPEAEIVQWHVREGETVREDQVIVSMETAKAVVEVPSPCSGVIVRQFGQPGDLIHTGESLVEFEGEDEDTGTVVGSIQESESLESDDDEQFFVGASPSTARIKEMVKPAVAHLTRNFERAPVSYELENGEPLRGVRREMAKAMAKSGREVVSVTLFADADIHSWDENEDLSVRIIQALTIACQQEPALNAWFDEANEQRQLMNEVKIGLAVDSPHGLFVPVMRNTCSLSAQELRTEINALKSGVKQRKLPPEVFQGATISVSNFGALGCGRYATPVVVPPAVAILGVGSVGDQVVPYRGQPAVHKVVSLSLSFDHRAATGGEAARFLKTVVQQLEQKEMNISLQG
ncbi:dihydrolipoamide acetyltransferase family protein [Sansalvadorimonas verongulae]|uniref:dihydrolipoamide acetyltransferase family protein n=1 Tax=Sansalvadorimonas verongulae TaxID=2172824 RepID=UPI002E346184|nr:dihydrolipoamide acetyltransferase family protein [Sansalvadorimonas verongulae]MTI13581.1 2-oxo acid dehydrogenase subunit E2 [Sansalvadorimonas verongulae]